MQRHLASADRARTRARASSRRRSRCWPCHCASPSAYSDLGRPRVLAVGVLEVRDRLGLAALRDQIDAAHHRALRAASSGASTARLRASSTTPPATSRRGTSSRARRDRPGARRGSRRGSAGAFSFSPRCASANAWRRADRAHAPRCVASANAPTAGGDDARPRASTARGFAGARLRRRAQHASASRADANRASGSRLQAAHDQPRERADRRRTPTRASRASSALGDSNAIIRSPVTSSYSVAPSA